METKKLKSRKIHSNTDLNPARIKLNNNQVTMNLLLHTI